jgi:hypothetical protein
MKKLFLVSAFCICNTTLSSANENQIDIRSISHMLVDIARAPLSKTHGQGYATALLASGEDILHPLSNLKLKRIGNHVHITDTMHDKTIWMRSLADVLYASWDTTGEHLEVCCRDGDVFADDTEHLIYRVAYLSTLQQLNKQQLAFMRTCYDYWKKNKHPFLVMNDNQYIMYQTLPEDLKQRSIFQLSDTMRRRAEQDYYKKWLTLPFDVMRSITSCCRMKGT